MFFVSGAVRSSWARDTLRLRDKLRLRICRFGLRVLVAAHEHCPYLQALARPSAKHSGMKARRQTLLPEPEAPKP